MTHVSATENEHTGTKNHESEIGISQRWGLNGTLGAWILGLLGFGIIMLLRTNTAKAVGDKMKNWMTFESAEQKAERKARITKTKVDSKAYAIKTLGDACGSAEIAVGKEKISWTGSMDLRNFIDWMLEGKRFLRWNWNLIMASIIGILFIGVLGLYAFKQPTKIIINNDIPVAITPTVTPVVNPEPVNEVRGDDSNKVTPHDKVTTVVFDVPGENEDGFKPITPDFTIPYSPNGWRFEVTWTGNPVWYPVANDYQQYIDMRAGQNVDIGNHNPDKMNYSFQSLDGKPAQVILRYWSKVGV